jgi:hypothetical protein
VALLPELQPVAIDQQLETIAEAQREIEAATAIPPNLLDDEPRRRTFSPEEFFELAENAFRIILRRCGQADPPVPPPRLVSFEELHNIHRPECTIQARFSNGDERCWRLHCAELRGTSIADRERWRRQLSDMYAGMAEDYSHWQASRRAERLRDDMVAHLTRAQNRIMQDALLFGTDAQTWEMGQGTFNVAQPENTLTVESLQQAMRAMQNASIPYTELRAVRPGPIQHTAEVWDNYRGGTRQVPALLPERAAVVRVTGGPDANPAVQLPQAMVGRQITIINNSAAPLHVTTGAAGDDVPSGTSREYVSHGAGAWSAVRDGVNPGHQHAYQQGLAAQQLFRDPAEVERMRQAARQAAVDTQKAAARGMELLKSWLSPEQRACFERNHFFFVTGNKTGKRYRINTAPSYNIAELGHAAVVVAKLCFLPKGILVQGDVMLAQKIALECDEESALRVANIDPVDRSGARRPQC